MPPLLFLTDMDVATLVTVEDAISALERAFATWAAPGTANLPRQRLALHPGFFNVMAATDGADGVFGLKAYYVLGEDSTYHVALYAKAEGRLLAFIEATQLSMLRTGAATGLATKILANPDASVVGIIGAGGQALAQVAALCAVRPITAVRVFSRSPERRAGFARRVEETLGVAAVACRSGQSCVDGADIVVTITKSPEPVLRSEWLADGTHVNAAGANTAARRELDYATVLRAAVRVTDDKAQARSEAAEFIDLVAQGRMDWDGVSELGDLVAGRAAGRRSPADVTLFKSLGIALEDVAFAHVVYRRALERQVGRSLGGG